MLETQAPTDWSRVSDFMEDNTPQARYALDAKLHVQFYMRPIIQEAASEEARRPIYKDVEHVRIMIPGDKLNIVDRIASQDDRQRFAAQYAKFQAGQGQEVIGTRLEAVPWMTRSKVEEYKFFNIVTVEQLAACSDEVGGKFPSFQSDKRRAQEFLDASTGTDARVAELEKQLAEMREMMANSPQVLTSRRPAAE